ncbi:glutenin, high molecular weight subunit PW212-like [Spodoptera litura]|uniref:Glutenin, high molecular weight subunit PW212-like n=1 Tax=Spodoptera litura TaxID=69820 RepID=A0A9J7EHS4_SPOLT|nr:glutenin, high molecular weight subunit PW212-like [Spodoptera litura]XP_022828728.1 glutenin, high molecular weight subunit PW212-like [Spodoptera litura]XP_022828729.1 glutenin, high molecular weight subunit PW212-like [Spodoptera litura]
MLGIVFTVLSVSVACHADIHNSSSEPMRLFPPPPPSRRMSSNLVDKLRRQLMRDNYDYQNGNSNERRKQNATRSDAAAAGSAEQRMQGNLYVPDQPEQPEQFKQAEPLQEPAQFEQPEQFEQPQDGEPPQREPPPQREAPLHRPQRQQWQRGHRFEQRKRYDRPQQKQTGDWPRYQDGAPPTDQRDDRDYSPDSHGNPTHLNKRRDALDDGFVNQMQVAPVGQRYRKRQQQRRGQGGGGYMREEGPTPPIDLDETDTPLKNEPHDNPENVDQPEQQNEREVHDASEQQNEHEVHDAPDQQDNAEQHEHSDQQDHPEQQNDQASDYSDAKRQRQAVYDEFAGRGNKQPQRGGRPTGPPPQNKRDHQISNKDLLYYMDDKQLRRNNIASDYQSFSAENESDEQNSIDNSTHTNRAHVNASRVTPGGLAPGRAGPHRANFSYVYANGTKLNVGRRMDMEVNATVRPRLDHTKRTFVVTVAGANVTYKLLTLKSHDQRRSGSRRFLEERAPHSVALISLDKAPLPAFRLPRMRRQYMHEPHDHRNPLDDVMPHHRHPSHH